jgi:PPK2 family polyphosphate:nucleotide phosphotransferase
MNNKDFSPFHVKHHAHLQLGDIDTQPPKEEQFNEDELAHQRKRLAEKLNKLQTTLYAGKEKSLLLILQGMDTSGKDGVIRSVFRNISPLGVHAVAFGAPSEEESRHDFLWRVHNKVPARGEMAIFNRSHYEDVLVPRVRSWIRKHIWEERYQHIVNFESMLHDEGVTILKCYLHISKQEQKQRLKDRFEDPHKQWKLQQSDFEDRKRWDDFRAAYEDALSATSTEQVPWHIVPADSKPYRDLFVAGLLVQTMEKMDLKLPPPSFDLSTVKLL